MNQPLDLHNIPFHSFVLEASAGTGKTYSLVRIYLNWTLERGLDPLRLPVLTFTEDAAAEMRNRIGEELRGLLLQASERDPKRSRLIHLIEKLPTAPIGTIHSFCYKLLGRFPLELGVSFPLEMAPKNHRRQVFNDYLWREPVPWEAAQHVNWQRDRKNLEDFLFELYSQGWGQTRAGEVFPSEEFLELIPEDIYLWPARDPEGWGKLAKKESESDQSLGNYDLKRHSGKKAVEEEEKAKKRLLFLRGCRQYLEDFESHYAANGLDQGLVDFDDMIELVHQGICSPDSAFSERLKECYQGIIVDEFQDTNAPQWRIIQRGFYRQGLPVVIIGDPKQSIYLFRGGEPEVYFYAKKEILADAPAEQVRAFVLDQNFRSSPALIEGMNRWFTPVFDQGAMIFSPSKPPAEETGKISAAWEDPLEPPMEGPLVPQPSAGLDLPVDYTKDRWAEVVVNHIQDLMSRRLRYIPRHSKEETPVARTLHYGDIAILVQKHKHGNRLFDLCQKAGIPVRKTKGVNLFQTEEMLFFQRFLKILQNPRDEGLLAAFLIQGPLAVTWQGFYQLKEEENLGGCRMILAQARDRWAEEGVLMFWAVINSLQSELDRLKDPGPKDETGRGKTVEERLICRTGGERVLMNYRQILGLFIGKKKLEEPAGGRGLPPGGD
jgi:exodeoxyribonuclease V beta subunit